MTDFADDSILVLLDVTPSGALAKSAAGLLGAAAAVGTPVALVVGDDALARRMPRRARRGARAGRSARRGADGAARGRAGRGRRTWCVRTRS